MMDTTVWKFELWPNRKTHIADVPMPEGAQLLAVQTQRARPYLWALVNRNYPLVSRRFFIAMTGGEGPPAGAQYVGTYQIHGDFIVGHVFDLGEDKKGREA